MTHWFVAVVLPSQVFLMLIEGDIGGYPIPQYRKKKMANTEIPRRKSSKYRYRIF